jgi:hypothetical protein
MVRKFPKLGTSGAGASSTPTPALVPGSAEWRAIKAGNDSIAGYGAPANKDKGGGKNISDAIIVSASSPDSLWSSKKVKAVGGGLAIKSIFLPAASPVSSAIHTGDEAVFGCAFSVLDISPGNRQRCDGISIFPVGYKWVTLAYECMSYNILPIYEGSMLSPPTKADKVTARDRKLIRLVQELLTEQVELRPVGYNGNLTEAVKVLFAPWTGEEKSGGDVYDEAEEVSAPAALASTNGTSAHDFDEEVDYRSVLYKAVMRWFGAEAAETITYLKPIKDGQQFSSQVSFNNGDQIIKCAGKAKKAKISKVHAAYACISMLSVGPMSGDEPAARGPAPLSPKKPPPPPDADFAPGFDYKGELSGVVKERFGKAAWHSIVYTITSQKNKIDGVLTFSLANDGVGNPFYTKNVKGMASKKQAKRQLAFEGLREVQNMLDRK